LYHSLLKGCDSNFEVNICQILIVPTKWNIYLALNQYVLGYRLKSIITMVNNLTDNLATFKSWTFYLKTRITIFKTIKSCVL